MSSLRKWRTPEIFLGVKKRWLFVIGAYSVVFFLGELTVIGHAANSFLLELGILSGFVGIFLWVLGDSFASPETSKIGEVVKKQLQTTAVQENLRIWMVLHKVLQSIELVAMAVAFLAAIIGSQIATLPEVRVYYFVWALLLSCLTFAYFHRIRNILGMQCTEIEGGSLVGARAFSKLASQLLTKKNYRGVEYLLVSLLMLKKGFRSKDIVVDKMDETIETVFIAKELSHFPHNLLSSLSQGIAETSLLSDVPKLFQDFVSSEESQFAKGFKTVKRQRGTSLWLQRLSLIAVFITAVGTLTQAVMSEDIKESIVSFLMLVFGSPSLVSVIILFALLIVLARYLNRFDQTSVPLKDLKKIDTT